MLSKQLLDSYLRDCVEVLHYLACSQTEESRVRVRACETLLRYIPALSEINELESRLSELEEQLSGDDNDEEDDEVDSESDNEEEDEG